MFSKSSSFFCFLFVWGRRGIPHGMRDYPIQAPCIRSVELTTGPSEKSTGSFLCLRVVEIQPLWELSIPLNSIVSCCLHMSGCGKINSACVCSFLIMYLLVKEEE